MDALTKLNETCEKCGKKGVHLKLTRVPSRSKVMRVCLCGWKEGYYTDPSGFDKRMDEEMFAKLDAINKLSLRPHTPNNAGTSATLKAELRLLLELQKTVRAFFNALK